MRIFRQAPPSPWPESRLTFTLQLVTCSALCGGGPVWLLIYRARLAGVNSATQYVRANFRKTISIDSRSTVLMSAY